MKEKVEANYAGFTDKVTDKNRKRYTAFSSRIENDIMKATDFKQCTKLMREWLSFFDDGHLYLSINDTTEYHPTYPPSF